MPWAKLDDGWFDNPKIMAAGAEARGLHATAINYCAKHLTDGELSEPVALYLAGLCVVTSKPIDLLDRMVEHTLFDCLMDGDAVTYRVHDYLDCNPTRAEAKAQQEANHQAKVAAGLASAKARVLKFGSSNPRLNILHDEQDGNRT